MSNSNPIQPATELIIEDFGLNWKATDFETEAFLLEELSNAIAWMMEHRLEFLFNTLYRMDVDETKMTAALSPKNPEPANITLAKIVIERQKLRLKTKQEYQQEKPEDWEDF